MLRSGWNRTLLGVALVTAASAATAQAGTCSLPPWNTPAPGPLMGAAVFGHAATSAGGYVYSASGASAAPPAAGDVVLFQRYDPASNAWTSLADVPIPVAGASLAYDAVGGRLFLFGGNSSFISGNLSLVQVYHIGPGTWDPPGALSMPGPRAGMASGVIGNFIYLVGGRSTSTTVETQNWQFDPATLAFLSKTSLPTPVARSGSAVSGGRLYVISGEEAAGAQVNTNYEYNPATNTWATKAPIPPPAVNGPGATALGAMNNCNDDIIVIGGGTPFLPEKPDTSGTHGTPDSTDVSQLYNVATDTWSPGPTLPSARFGLRAAQAGDTLIAFGGWNGSSNVTTVDRIQGPPLPVALQGFRVE